MNDAGLAAAERTADNLHPERARKLEKEQTEAIREAVEGRPGATNAQGQPKRNMGYTGMSRADASRSLVQGVRRAWEALRTEERRLWQTPEMRAAR